MALRLAALLSLAACAPKTYEIPFLPPPRGAVGAYGVDDPVRDELREVLIPCTSALRALRTRRVERRRVRRLISALVAVAASFSASYLANRYQEGGLSSQGAVWRSERCAGPSIAPECTGIAGGTPQAGIADLLQDRGDDSLVIPGNAVRLALHAVDSLLWETPNPTDWEHAQWDAWDARRDALRQACREASAVVRDGEPESAQTGARFPSVEPGATP